MLGPVQTNRTALNDDMVHGWMSSPGSRGTSDILYSCFLTISACVYSSVHLNIPEPQEKQRWQILRRLKWTLIGIFAPEVVLFAAWIQYTDAQAVIKRMCKVAPDLVYMEPSWYQKCFERLKSISIGPKSSRHSVGNAESGETMINQPSTKSYASETIAQEAESRQCVDSALGFYLIMGGVRIDTSHLHDQQKSLALSSEVLLDLLHPDRYPGRAVSQLIKSLLIDPNTIRDRSKANIIGKILICLQVFGMAVQCSARAIVGLPSTLLEIHTFAHVICAICIYTIWLRKPLDVNEATTVNLPNELQALLAQSVMFHCPQKWTCELVHSCGSNPQYIDLQEDAIDFTGLAKSAHTRDDMLRLIRVHMNDSLGLNQVRHQLNEGLESQGCFLETERNVAIIVGHDILSCNCLDTGGLQASTWPEMSEIDKCRWSTAHTESFDDRIEQGERYPIRVPNCIRTWHQSLQLATKKRNSGFKPSPVVWTGISHLLKYFADSFSHGFSAFVILGTYAAIHALAWHVHFPSLLEQKLWQASCLSLLLTIPLLFAMLFIINLDARHDEKRQHQGSLVLIDFLIYVLIVMFYPMFYILPLFSITARFYIIFETLFSLRSVPAGVYVTIPWSHYLPYL